jgi:hypothetical protein
MLALELEIRLGGLFSASGTMPETAMASVQCNPRSGRASSVPRLNKTRIALLSLVQHTCLTAIPQLRTSCIFVSL